MAKTLDPELKQELAARLRFYHELGIYDFYRRKGAPAAETMVPKAGSEEDTEAMATAKRSSTVAVAGTEPIAAKLVKDPVAALRAIREDIGDCTRCVLHKQGRKQIVFGVGNPQAELMFVGEAPGADEDEQVEPFVGRAG